MEFSTAYTSQQVGVAERMNRTVLTIMRVLIFDSGLPRSFWLYAAPAAAHIRNRTVTVGRTGKTPYELWTGKKLNLSNMRIWGCKCWIHLLNEKDKLNPRAEEGIFISYTNIFDQYLVFLSDKHKIMKATNPRFIEESESCKSMEIPQLGGVEQDPGVEGVEADESSSEDEIEDEIEISLSPPSSPTAADQTELQNPTPTNATK